MNHEYYSELLKIVNQAHNLSELVNQSLISQNNFQESQVLVNAKVDEWCKLVAKGNWEQFEKRLAWDGLNLNLVRQRLASSVINNDKQDLPDWAKTLNECLKASYNPKNMEELISRRNSFVDSQDFFPYEEILPPFIYVSRKKLISRLSSGQNLLSEEAYFDLERSITKRLVSLLIPLMEHEFSNFLAIKQSSFIRYLKRGSYENYTLYYQEFIKNQQKKDLLKLFEEYPVLARLLGTSINLWIDSNVELILRLASDWSEIQSTFQPQTELGQVIAIQTDLSDLHEGNRSVTIITFASGLKVVYKPKNLDLEEAYTNLLAYFNQLGFPLPFKIFKLVKRPTYGWVEFIETLPCKNEEQTKRFYQRTGIILCLAYVLGATDLHSENLIACEEHPVLIDTETLMHPWVKSIHDLTSIENAESLASQKLWRSVLRTAFLPIWEIEHKSNFKNVVNFKKNHLNANKLKPKLIKNSSFLKENSLGKNQHNYYDFIIKGFQEFYRFLIRNRNQLFDLDSKLIELANQPVRFVFRDTKTYTLLLQKSLEPQYLRNGIDRSIQIDILSRLMILSDSKPVFWSLLSVEKQALEQIDIPKFTSYSSSDSLTITPKENLEHFFVKPSYEITVELINHLSEEDLAEQTAIIQGSLYSHDNLEVHNALGFSNSALDWNLVVSLNKQSLVQDAIVLAKEIQKKSISGIDGSVTWIEPQYNFNYRYFHLNKIGHNLYDGSCGIALFLAALEHVTGEIGFTSLALAALRPINKMLIEPDYTQYLVDMGIGGGSGLGSVIYAFVCISQFIKQPELLKNAKSISSLITSDLIAHDKSFDVLSGSAGAILGLLALYKFSNDTEVLEQAITCGYHLINNRQVSTSGYRSWAINDKKLLAGFSHGAAGICYALLSLYKVTSNSVFLDAAEEGIAYERSIFIPDLQNWPNLNFSPLEKGFTSASSWCHGASGIGLARVGGVNIFNTSEIQQDIESALNTTIKYPIENIDNICCGNLGRVEFILTAGKRLSRPELVEVALKQAMIISDRAKDRGNFDYSFSGFFQGASGIGYELLRLAYPEQLPSVLLWE